jgi:hypothetical protein
LATNIVSIRQLNEVGYKIDINTGVMKIWEPGGMLLVRVKHEANHLYLLHIKLTQPACFTVCGWGDELVWHWHERFGHVNMVAPRNMAREDLVRTSFLTKAEYQARRRLELVHDDLCGPIAPVTPRGNKYFLLLVDYLSMYMWVVMIPSKDHAAVAIKEIKVQTEGESGLKLRSLPTNCGGEFTARGFTENCMTEDMHHQHIASYNLQ